MNLSRNIMLFGTQENAGELTKLSAGILEATLDAGNLRYITIAGKEALRAIAFLVRDRDWGTYNPKITNLAIKQDGDDFNVSYDAVCSDDKQSFAYRANIRGRPDGSLVFSADCEALSDVLTNRTGFVVLHSLDGVVGEPVTVEHTDGRIEQSHFPEHVNPACPFEYIRSLAHEIMPGVKVVCRMEGDAFEMEDHRNWMDASYKTYVRPLALPWPYTIAKGEKFSQSVTLSLEGKPPSAAATGEESITIAVGRGTGREVPRIGLAVPAEHAEAAINNSTLLKQARPGFLVCHFDLRQGHDASTMKTFAELGSSLETELVLEAIVPCLDADGKPSDDVGILRRDLAAIASAAEGVGFARVAVSPSTDLKCTLPGSKFPPAPTWHQLCDEARKAFPGAIIGGGMFSYFTELNRKRPPADLFDFICHSGCPIVHAGDDISVSETLEALPSIFKSVRAFSGSAPYWVFPAAISMRDNPYGAAPAENPDNIRQAMNRIDPRERGLLGAAWYAGYLAHAARAGVDAVTLAATTGPSGIVCAGGDWKRPWFENGDAQVYPHYHILAGHFALKGEVLEVASSDNRNIQALAVAGKDETRLWLSNQTGAKQSVRIAGISGRGDMLELNEDCFAAACKNAAWLSEAPRISISAADQISLSPYGVAELRFRNS